MNHPKKQSVFGSLYTKMILWILLFLVPILLILCVSMKGILTAYSKQMTDTYAQSVRQFTADIDAVLNGAKRILYSEDLSFDFMKTQPGSSLKMLEEMETLGKRLTDSLTAQEKLDAFFVYSNGTMIFVQNYNTSYVENKKMADLLEERIKEDRGESLCPDGKYQVLQNGGGYCFYLAVELEDGIFGCWFSEKRLLENVREAGLSGMADVWFTQEDGTELGGIGEIPASRTITRQELTAAPLSLTVLWDKDIIYQTLYQTERLLGGVTVLAFLLLLAYLLFLRNSLFVPLRRLTQNIGRLRTGQPGKLKRAGSESVEFQEVYEALITMTNEIRDLKIDVYEKEIGRQKARLELYQLQIRPHFFMNVLNNIQCLSRGKRYVEMDEMITMLTSHCRYVLYNSQTVLLDEELNFIRNYIRLQSIQHNRRYQLEIDCPEGLLDQEIPILVIQILVENAIKHAGMEDEVLKIRIEVEERDKESGKELVISVIDNGLGLPEEALEKLQNAASVRKPKDHHGIGIDNIRRRLALLYGERAGITFQNEARGGTRVELKLPLSAYLEAREEGER